ncbi:hypothetical protein SAMN05216284_114148 [Micromonospora sediminimaris]|uniref:Uncharacterized protein n=1 Tax=Micromonospora sediminimaris TaxID=547162 RepID=A0A9W5UST3_9ACTN|nr:hypothetical protein Vse01_36000 [Micromonospora sediminimaris]SFD29879.1 hypothetical protein SAMN05216284_114148 [Micromonospora sediminimaris]
MHSGTLTISLREELARYPAYTPLQGRLRAIRLDRGQIGWMEKHWRQHRSDS